MIPRILSSGETAPAGALVLDGAAPGGAATYSHWQQAPACPTELDADTSTGMALRAAADPGRWLGGFTWAVNDHVDADGLLSLAVACRPEVGRAHAAEILGAAEAGDFATWPGEAPFRLMLLIHQLMRNAKGDKLINIAAQHYKDGGFSWGNDARFYVAALAYINRDYDGLIFPAGWTDVDFKAVGRWADIGIKSDHALWIPSKATLQPLKGTFVSSGSITYEMWQMVKQAAAAGESAA